jgi:lysine decarboxylase
VPAAEAVGRISADSLAAYPPGVPNILPGEVLTRPIIDFLRSTAASPYGWVRGSLDPAVDHVRVIG